ncbi:hypothetical protein Tco_1247757 [Tanacetum coccineum]
MFDRSSVKLLPEIELLLQTNPTRERIFRRTVLGPWLDILSRENDNHLMYYVLQHQYMSQKIPSDAPPVILHIDDHLTKTGVKKVKSCELLKLLRDKKGWLALSDMDANDYPWGKYPWDKFYKRTVNIVARHRDHHLAEKEKNPNFNATYNLYGFAWAFKLVDEERNMFLDDCVGVLKDNGVDGQHQLGYDTERPANVSIAELFAEVRALSQEVALIKVDDERIANVERLLKEKLQNDFATEKTKRDMIPNHSKDIQNYSFPDVTSNHTVVDQVLGGSSDDPMSTCSCPDMDNTCNTFKIRYAAEYNIWGATS